MRIKDEIFEIVVDICYAGIHHSKYWMSIHYDIIEDGQNKTSHLLFSKYHDKALILPEFLFIKLSEKLKLPNVSPLSCMGTPDISSLVPYSI